MFKGRNLFQRIVRKLQFAKTIRMRNQRPIISFTFDDFPHSAVINGANILERCGAHGTFYVAGSYCGRVVDGVAQYCAEDIQTLSGAGHEIGCHTFHHRRVSALTTSVLIDETKLNAAFIAQLLPGVVMRTFAYPYGDVSFGATLELQRIFVGCRSSQFGINKGTADLGRLRAIRLYNRTINFDDIFDLIQKAKALNSWLIFYTHDVDDVPSKFGCTPALFDHAVKTAVSSGAEILPVSEAIRVISHGST
jgi:peptidoglycan/xylan/chitin deacetylase (PgdA/CDA1 family)